MRNAVFIGAALMYATAIALAPVAPAPAPVLVTPRRQTALRARNVRRQRADLSDMPQPGTGTVSPKTRRSGSQRIRTIRCSSTTAATTGRDTARPASKRRDRLDDDSHGGQRSARRRPEARTVVLRRGIPTTLNTPALDPALMVDGRAADAESQATGAIRITRRGRCHQWRPARDRGVPEDERILQLPRVRRFALEKGAAPGLPKDRRSQKSAAAASSRTCHRIQPMDSDRGSARTATAAADEPDQPVREGFHRLPIPAGQRFISVGVSEFNEGGNPVRKFIFNKGLSTNSSSRARIPDAH